MIPPVNGRGRVRLYHERVFDSLSGAEILTIAVIALVVFGPHRLPDIARSIGRYVRELRQAVSDLRRGIEQEVGPIREPIKEIRRDLTQPAADVRRTFTETAETAKEAGREIRRAAKDPPAPPSAGAAPAAEADEEEGGAREAPGPNDAEDPLEQADEAPVAAGGPPQQTGADPEEAGPADDEGSGGEPPPARWTAPEPAVGVSPSESREGMGDPMPAVVHPPPEETPAADGEDKEKKTGRGAAPDEAGADGRAAGQ